MHLGNDAITLECAYLTMGVAAAGLGYAASRVRREPVSKDRLATTGALCAAVFAAQMVNVPMLPFSSGHLVGGVLLAWCLGPALGSLCMAAVLVVQAVLLGDGGLMALGANIVNMALLPAALVWFAQRYVAKEEQRAWPKFFATGGVAVAAVVLAAGLIVAQVSLFRSGNALDGLGPFAARMLAVHAWIGLGEGLITGVAVLALGTMGMPSRARLIVTVATSLLLVLVLLPLASVLPDGYEASAAASGLESLLANAEIGWQASLQSSLEGALVNPQLVAFAAMCLAALLACAVAFACQARLAPANVAKRP